MAASGGTSGEGANRAGHARHILVVEDSDDDLELMLRALRGNNIGNEIVTARDGVEALDHLFQGKAPLPAVVLLDLNLPRVDGLEVLRRIRADPRTKVLPGVILTSSREERDVVEGYRLGVNSFVRKPVDFTQFADAVRQLGLYWLLLNEPPPERGPPAKDGADRR